MGVRRLMRTSADAVRDRVGRLAGEADRLDSFPDAAVELGQARTRPAERDGVLVHAEEPLLELAVLVAELAHDEVLRVVAPVAVGTDPDLEQRRLSVDDRSAGGR